MKKRILAMLLLCALLASVVSGCGSTADTQSASSELTESASDTSAAEAKSEETEAPESSESVEEASLNEPEELEAVNETIELPLVDEPTTITYWAGGWDGTDFGLVDPNDILMTQEYERRTGIHVDYTVTSYDANEDQTSLMFASGDYLDVLPITYSGGLEKGVDDGVYMVLNDLLEEYMPNYSAIRSSDSTVYKDTMTDNGNVIALYEISQSIQPPWYGLLCRADYLDAVGLDVPVTYDDMHEVLTAFKNQLGLTHAYQLSSNGYSILGNCMMAGFDTSQTWYQVDGEAVYGPITDNFKKYLQTMNQWYEEGLISADFVTASPFDDADIMSGNSGVFTGDYLACTGYLASMGEGARVIGISEPVENEGDEIHVGLSCSRTIDTGKAIATTCSDPELILRWFDYAYTEEGSLLCNYGVEGETFYYDENGDPTFTELITNNPDGLTVKQAISSYVDMGPGISLSDWRRELSGVNEDSINAMEAWAFDGAHVYPEKTTMSADEGTELTAIMSDIETYVSTMILSFITGETSFEEWDNYVAYIENSDIEDAIAIKQEVLDRYNNR